MKSWPLQNAKNQFSRVVDEARKSGPQLITRHGRPVAVLISSEDYQTETRPKESVFEFFAPLHRSGVRLKRNRELPRQLST